MTDQQIIATARYNALSNSIKNIESALGLTVSARNSLTTGYADDNYFIANLRVAENQLRDLLNKARREYDNQRQQANPVP